MDAMEKLKELRARVEAAEILGNQRIAALQAQLEEARKQVAYEKEMAEGFQKQFLAEAHDAAIARRLRELLDEIHPSASTGGTGKNVSLADVKYTVDLKDDDREITEETTTCKGRLLKLMKTGFFDEPKTIKDIAEIFPKKGWPDEEKTIANNIAEMFRESFFTKEQIGDKSHRRWVYGKPEGIVFK